MSKLGEILKEIKLFEAEFPWHKFDEPKGKTRAKPVPSDARYTTTKDWLGDESTKNWSFDEVADEIELAGEELSPEEIAATTDYDYDESVAYYEFDDEIFAIIPGPSSLDNIEIARWDGPHFDGWDKVTDEDIKFIMGESIGNIGHVVESFKRSIEKNL